MKKIALFSFLFILFFQESCRERNHIFENLSALEGGKRFAVPTGTVADKFVLKRFPDAKLEYYNSVYDCALAVQNGKVDATVYDKPVLQNIASKTADLSVIPELLLPDNYGFAVRKDSVKFKELIDGVLDEIKRNGMYDDMSSRWFPALGAPKPMPVINIKSDNGTIRFGTAALTEPMSFFDKDRNIVGFDVEFASYIAQKAGRKLEIINLDFGALLPALISGKVDMIGAGISITEERAKKVLFSKSYYNGGLVAMVKKSSSAKEPVAISNPDSTTLLSEKKLGVLMGSIHDAYVSRTYPGAQIYPFNTMPDMLLALKAGKVDAVFVDHTSTKEIFSKNADFGILKANIFTSDIAAGFRKQDTLLRSQYNRFLKTIKSNGIYDQMVDRWMNQRDAALPQIPLPKLQGRLNVGVVSDIGLPFTVKSGEIWKGFDVELSARFAASLGNQLVLTDIPFGSLLPSLVSGKIDLISASMMITPERKKQIDFSDPYYSDGATIIVLKGINRASTGEPGTAKTGDTNEVSSGTRNTFFKKLSDSFYTNIVHEKRYLMILKGLWITILISILASIVGTLLGGLICYFRMSKNKFFQLFSGLFISLIRGTPVLVLLMIIYYIVFASVNINPVFVAVVAFGINFAAYVSEMFRTSIESIDKGQNEAGIASGFTKIQSFIHIIMPQALRQVLPVYKGEFISLIKMTSVVGYIAVEDLTKASDIIRSRTFDAFFPLIMAAVIYIFIAWGLTLILDYAEFKVSPGRSRLSIKNKNTK